MHAEHEWEPGRDEPRPHRHPGRGRGRGPGRRGFGGPGFGPPGFGGFGPWLGEPRFARGPKVRRGDVRAAALALLAEEPRNGYQIIREIAERSGGVWQPSPGSVYPALQQLEDEELIHADTSGERRRYELTATGREYVTEHAEELRAPWEAVADSVDSDAIELRRMIGQVAMAAVQVAQVGTRAQVDQSRQILTEARRRLYRILAADDEENE